ncbi:MAG: metallophosphoesterase [Gemmataceae bacterium]
MPDPARLLLTLNQAITLFRATPGRRGRVIALENATEVMVTGDLHGNVDNFRRLLQKADLGNNPRRHLVLQEVVHGPFRYPDGGDRSHQLLDLVAALKCQFPHQVHFLIGNHELSQGTQRRIAKNDIDLNELFRQGVATAYGARGADVYRSYLELFAVAPLAVRTSNRVFISHSLPSAMNQTANFLAGLEKEQNSEADLLPGGCVHALVWGRDTSANNAAAFLKLVDADWLITGHIPCDQGYDRPNPHQIILDSLGAVAAYCLFPTEKRLNYEELSACVATL